MRKNQHKQSSCQEAQIEASLIISLKKKDVLWSNNGATVNAAPATGNASEER